MRKRFEQQLSLGQIPIEETYINPKKKYALDELLAALKAIYCNPDYHEKIFSDELVAEINGVILDFGYGNVLKKEN